jgi:hypothetical protein
MDAKIRLEDMDFAICIFSVGKDTEVHFLGRKKPMVKEEITTLPEDTKSLETRLPENAYTSIDL